MTIDTINPATEVILATYPLMDKEDVDQALHNASKAFSTWSVLNIDERGHHVKALALLLKQQLVLLSQQISNEMGKPIMQSIAEIEKCIYLCEHYAMEAVHYLKSRTIPIEKRETTVSCEPLGVIFGIMPWNFPFWQVFRFAIPTLMAGNVVIFKHAPNTTGVGESIARLSLEAGFPAYVWQHLIISNESAKDVITDDKVAALSFTGSEKTGRQVGAYAAASLKKSVLELGGNDPYIIFADADIALAAQSVISSRLNNCGQVCIAAKRVFVLESIYDAFVQQCVQLAANYFMGKPLDSTTQLGPMARKDLRDTLHQQVQESIEKGAQLLSGGVIPSQKGYYYPVTFLTDVKPGMPAFDDELFGPVLVLIKCQNDKEAIALANQSRYGLSAALFSKNTAYAKEVALQIKVGTCFINGMVASDPRVPFGGIKQSGFGRELSQEGILEFVNVKTIAVNQI